jgi:hypothetical protein
MPGIRRLQGMAKMAKLLTLALLAFSLAALGAAASHGAQGNNQGGITGDPTSTASGSFTNDYPTSARADYVFGCMAVNGQTQETLDRCSCAIDVVASILPYQQYLSAETVLQMQQEKSVLAEEFRTAAAKEIVRRLREAEAEGEVRCF